MKCFCRSGAFRGPAEWECLTLPRLPSPTLPSGWRSVRLVWWTQPHDNWATCLAPAAQRPLTALKPCVAWPGSWGWGSGQASEGAAFQKWARAGLRRLHVNFLFHLVLLVTLFWGLFSIFLWTYMASGSQLSNKVCSKVNLWNINKCLSPH